MTTDLIAIQENALAEYNVTDEAIGKLKEKYGDTEAESKEGYALVKDGIREVKDLRVSVEKKRKELKAGALEWGKKVDTEAKRITSALLEIEEPMKEQKKIIDDEEKRIKEEKKRKEQARVEQIQLSIRNIRDADVNIRSKSSEEIAEAITLAESAEINKEEYQEFTDVAQNEMNLLIKRLYDLKEQADAREEAEAKRAEDQAAKDAELAELRKQREAEQAEMEKERAAIAKEREEMADAKAKKKKPSKKKDAPKEQTWEERVAEIFDNPESASVDEVRKMAAQIMGAENA